MLELTQKSEFFPLMSSLCRNLSDKLSRCFAYSHSISKGKKGGLSSHRQLTRRWELAGTKKEVRICYFFIRVSY